jgi:NAD-dependent deacetylase
MKWTDGQLWRRSAINTLWCLIGCSIGDMGVIAGFQFGAPEVAASRPMLVMALAMTAGIGTSVLLETILQAEPNAAHRAVAALEQAGHFSGVVTQNIDGLHQRAGSKRVVEVHGSLETATCTQCYRTYSSADFLPAFLESGEVPRCPHCGAVLKPDVVLFGEQLPWQAWEEAQTMARQSDLMLIAGSSLAVMPVARLPVEAANHGAAVIIVNQTPTYMDARADVVLQGDVADILPAIAEEVLSP